MDLALLRLWLPSQESPQQIENPSNIIVRFYDSKHQQFMYQFIGGSSANATLVKR